MILNNMNIGTFWAILFCGLVTLFMTVCFGIIGFVLCAICIGFAIMGIN